MFRIVTVFDSDARIEARYINVVDHPVVVGDEILAVARRMESSGAVDEVESIDFGDDRYESTASVCDDGITEELLDSLELRMLEPEPFGYAVLESDLLAFRLSWLPSLGPVFVAMDPGAPTPSGKSRHRSWCRCDSENLVRTAVSVAP